MRRFVQIGIMAVLLASLLSGQVSAATRLQETASDKKVVIVIDPGHGGENLGTTENNHTEKLMTMTTALVMYEELLLYDNVEVYLTHREDYDLSLKKRAEFAASVDADFLFSIHYNASEYHEMFGAEVWVSAFQPYNGYGYQFGCEILSDIREQTGLLIRGVKTRFSSKGEDYYGIIRESAALGIPAVIIEHCHVDEERDAGYCDDDEKLKAFGKMDATAAARYFGLKSSVLQVDYSDYALRDGSVPKTGSMQAVKETRNDTTAPKICQIRLSAVDKNQEKVTFEVTAADDDSAILYYSYSLDGGKTFSPREPWPDSDALTGDYRDTFHLDLSILPDDGPEVVLRAYNLYDLYTESNVCNVAEAALLLQLSENKAADGEDTDSVNLSQGTDKGEVSDQNNLSEINDSAKIKSNSADLESSERNVDFMELLALCLGVASLMMMIMTVIQGITYHNRRKARSKTVLVHRTETLLQRRKDSTASSEE